MEEKKELNFFKKWLRHDYAPMVVAAGAIVVVMILVYLFFAQRDGEQVTTEEGPILAYSQNIEITSGGPAGVGRVRMSFYLKSEEAFEETMASKEHIIRDLTIEKLLAWEDEALDSPEGMEAFKIGLKKFIHEETGIPIEGVYFHEFIIN